MKHALRKYITPCGSALFMVVSTMAALIVLVTAMYMSVLSSRQVQYATFDQEQAYVTSTGIADAINARMKDSDKAFVLRDSLSALEVGESISTDGNGFSAFGASGTNDDTPIGAYTVDIIRLPDEDRSGKTVSVYDVAVTTSVNGVIETTHTYFTAQTNNPNGDMDHVDRFFTATGYLPNDVWIGTVVSDSALYFDTEYTIISKHVNSDSHGGDGDCNLNMDITCAGSLYVNQGQAKDFKAPRRWCVGNTLSIGSSFNSDLTLGGTATEHSSIYVGENLIYDANWKHFGEFTDVYVIGDLYANAGGWFDGNVYVNGDVIISTNNDVKFKNLYINGNVIGDNGVTPNMSNINVAGTWPDYEAKCVDVLDARIGGGNYNNWVVDTKGMTTEDIVFNTNDTALGANAKYIHYINKDCKIGKVYDAYSGSGTSVELTIIIDTGDDPDGGINLSVTPNCDDQGIKDTFMWYPEARASGGKIINILTIGCGKLVVDVPKGVTYQAGDREVFGHIGWFMTSGGTIETTSQGAPYFKRGAFDIYTVQDKIRANKFIVDGGENCVFESVEGKYMECPNEVHYTCTEHGGMYEQKDYDKFVNGFTPSLCRGRLDKKVMKKFLADNPSVMENLEKYYKNYYGKDLVGSCNYSIDSYCPNVNIFVVSCDQNADIQFGIKKANPSESLQANIFFGYVYAPYMTFVCIGDGGSMKSVGGLIVSDVQINGCLEFLFAQPDDSIKHLAGSGISLEKAVKKTWRRYGV